jgi:hypothetical protein
MWIEADEGRHCLIPWEVHPSWTGAPRQDGFSLARPVELVTVGAGVALAFGADPIRASTWTRSVEFAGGVLVVPIEWRGWPELPETSELLKVASEVTPEEVWDTDVLLPLRTGIFSIHTIGANDCRLRESLEQVDPGYYRVLAGTVAREFCRFEVYALDRFS